MKAREVKGFEAWRRWDLRGLFGEQALINLADILFANNIPYMIIGGMANAVWGKPMKRPHLNPPLKGEEVEWRQKRTLGGNKSADVGSKAIF